jgi:DnaK suppressor protein
LTVGQRALLRAELDIRRRQLLSQLALHQEGRTRSEHARDVLERDADDAPQRAMDREVDLALSDRILRELSEVEQALAAVEGPDYGMCAACGSEIPFDRLKVEPYARRCVGCESQLERRG